MKGDLGLESCLDRGVLHVDMCIVGRGGSHCVVQACKAPTVCSCRAQARANIAARLNPLSLKAAHSHCQLRCSPRFQGKGRFLNVTSSMAPASLSGLSSCFSQRRSFIYSMCIISRPMHGSDPHPPAPAVPSAWTTLCQPSGRRTPLSITSSGQSLLVVSLPLPCPFSMSPKHAVIQQTRIEHLLRRRDCTAN